MREIIYNTDIDKQVYEYKACMQGDDLQVKMNVLKNGVAYTLTGATAKLNIAKADGTPLTKVAKIEENTITCDVDNSYTNVNGKIELEFEITKDGTMTTFPVQLVVVEKVFQSEKVNNKIVELLDLIKIDEAIDDFMDSIKKKQTELSSRIAEKANEKDLQLQKARIDTFTKLEEGSTTADAELKDIRVGANGTTYENAGNAVREQFNELKEDLDEFKNSTFNAELVGKTKNLLNWNKISKGKIISGDGSLATNNLRWTTDFIPLTDKNRSVISSYLFTSSDGVQSRRERTWTHMACYDANRKYIEGTYSSVAMSKYTANDVTIKFIRLSYNPTQVGNIETDFYLMLEYGTSVSASLSDYVPYSEGTQQYTLKSECIPSDYHERHQFTINSEDGIYSFYDKMKSAYNKGNCDVFIKKGMYIYTNEFVDSVRSEGLRGIQIGNGCRYYFETGAKLYCEYTGENVSDVVGYFSPLDSQNTGGDFEIHNLDLVSKNTCYALHDESDGVDYFVKHYYKNCYIELDNTTLGNNGNSISKALGGGLGKYEEVIIEHCVFKATNPSRTSSVQDDASYHCANRQNITDAKLVITGCYFENRFRTSDLSAYPLESDFPRIIFTGNTSGEPVNIPNTWIKKIWNNEVRTD